MQLTDQVAIITGSARGIGRATALNLAREGASIVVVDINAAGAQEVAAEITGLRTASPRSANGCGGSGAGSGHGPARHGGISPH